jgi:3-oxoacyl-[acyl-carrier protein] reductase
MEDSLRGKVAIVTGAGRRGGIGAAICRALASRGADVLFTYWKDYDREMSWDPDEDGPDALRGELLGMGGRAEGLEIDLSLPDSPELLLDAATEKLGTPSILVNNAAYSVNDGYEDLDAATLDATYAVNLRATALLCVGFARRYCGETGGRIVNISSGQSLGPMPGELAYAATKGAIEAFTVTLAAEVGHKGITVNAVNPGPTDTGWMDDELRSELRAKFPGGRVGEPEDAARLVAFLAGEDAAWITGQVIHSEGGFLRQ